MPGKIVTFYSYKGGTGCSMALANVAWILAANNNKVLTIDWDFEAPGLHRYFLPFLKDTELEETKGLIDLLWDYVDLALMDRSEWPIGVNDPADIADAQRYAVPLEFPFESSQGCLHFLCAGLQDAKYGKKVRDFDWTAFYERLGGGQFLDELRKRLKEQYDYILIDSRTGVADTSGICTIHMPDTVVLCFTYNIQSIKGIASVAESINKQRPDEISILLVPMRVPLGIEGLEEARAFARTTLSKFLPKKMETSIQEYWEKSESAFRGEYAFHEVLAVFKDPMEGRNTLLRDMEWLAGQVMGDDLPVRIGQLDESLRRRYILILPNVFTSQYKRQSQKDHQFAHLMLNRYEQKAIVGKHLIELIRSDKRRVIALIAYAAPGNLLNFFLDQLRYYLELETIDLAEINWCQLKFPTDRYKERLQDNLEKELRLRLQADSEESFKYLLRRHAPRLISTSKRAVLWLNWGIFGDGPDCQTMLTREQLGIWLQFCREVLSKPSNCPDDLRIVSYLAIELKDEKHQKLSNWLNNYMWKDWALQPSFRISILPPLSRISENHLYDYLVGPSGCPPEIQLELVNRLIDETHGKFDITTELLQKGISISWYELLHQLRHRQDVESLESNNHTSIDDDF